MAKAIYTVLSNPSSDEADEAFNDWYTNEHVPHALLLDGWVAATRYRAWERPLDRPAARHQRPEQRYLCVYEWDVDHPQQGLDALARGNARGAVGSSPTLDIPTLRGYVYVPITERITRDDIRG